MQRIEPSRTRLEEAVALARRFYMAHGPATRGSPGDLTLEADGALALTLGNRPVTVGLVVGGFLVSPRRGYVTLTWGKAIHFRAVPSDATMADRARNSLFFHPRDGAERSATNMAALLLHELVHVEQQRSALLGLPGFLVGYVWGWVRGGFRYRANPYEVAAHALQGEAQRFFVEFPGSTSG